MTKRSLSPNAWKALATAGKCAIIFAPVFFLFLVATIFMVGGDGTAPGITHLSAAIVGLTTKLLGISTNGAAIPVVLFWSLAVFVVVFLYAMRFRSVAPTTDHNVGDQQNKYWAVFSIFAFVAAVLLLIRSHQIESASVGEKQQVLEFIKQNVAVMREVGGKGNVDLVSYTTASNAPITYDISVRGTKTIYAIVEASKGSKGPTFTLVCTTHLYLGQRDPLKHPCKQ